LRSCSFRWLLPALVLGLCWAGHDRIAAAEAERTHAERDRLWQEAQASLQAGDVEKAVAAGESMLALERQLLGDVHPEIALSVEWLAWRYQQLKDWDAARTKWQRALEIRTALHGKKNWQTINARLALEDVAVLARTTPEQRQLLERAEAANRKLGELHRQETYHQAASVAASAVEIYRDIFGEMHHLTAHSLNNLGGAYLYAGDYDRAVALFEEVLTIQRSVFGEAHPETAKSLGNLAGTFHAAGDHDKAGPLFLDALEKWREVFGEKHPETALSINNLASHYYATGQYERAEALHRRALEIRKEIFGDDHPHTAASLSDLGELYRTTGDYDRADPLLRSSLEIRQRILGKTHPATAVSLNNLARLYEATGDYRRAMDMDQQALEINRAFFGDVHPETASSLNNLAQVYRKTGNHAQAVSLLQESLKIRREVLGNEHPDTAMSLNNLGELYSTMGEYSVAEGLLLESLQILRNTLGNDHPFTGSTVTNLALLYQLTRRRERAESLLREGLEGTKRVLGEKHPDTITSLSNLAAFYRAIGEYRRAATLYQEALEASETALGDEHPDTGMVANNLAELYTTTGDYEQAELLSRRSVEIARKSLGEEHPNTANSLGTLAKLYAFKGELHRAEPLLRQALKIYRRYLDLSAAVQSERQQLLMAARFRYHMDAWLSMAPRVEVTAEEQHAEVLSWKGAIFSAQTWSRLELEDPDAAPLLEELYRVSRRIANLAWQSPGPAGRGTWQERLGALTNRKAELEQDLAGRSAEFRRQKANVTPAELQSVIPGATALVDLLVYDHYLQRETANGQIRLALERRLIAFVMRQDQTVARVDLGPVGPIEAALGEWRRSFSPAASAELRRLLWDHLMPHLEGVGTTLVAPDGALSSLPWGALPGSRPDQYLIEEMSFGVVPVPRQIPALLVDAAENASPASVLLVGNVSYGEGERAHPFAPLTHTAGEISRIQALFLERFPEGRWQRLDGEKATESAFRLAAPRHRWLHLATHGFFAPPDVVSALAPSAGDAEGGLFAREGVLGFHPGLLSGLALSGANAHSGLDGDDGILTSLEVAALDLRGVEMVVLSACETGLGLTAGGEGVLGLQRALQMSGANSAVASMWSVDDLATRLLMERFYRNLWHPESGEPGMGKLAALREAQLWMLRHGAEELAESTGRGVRPLPSQRLPPSYWAAFVLSGDWR